MTRPASLKAFSSRFKRVLGVYGENLRAFAPNARLYLVSAVLFGAAMGVFRLLFNFYLLSLGYDAKLVGNLTTASSLTSLFVALPIGYLADRLGRKRSLVAGNITVVSSIVMMVAFPSAAMFISMNVILGLAQSLVGVTMGPFLMENSTEKERTYLFSITSGLSTASGFVGNWVGGYLPTWMAGLREVSATSTPAYAASLLVIAAAGLFSLLPLAFLRTPRLTLAQRANFAPLSYFKKEPALLSKLILPLLATSIGAGLVMPFMNVFFRQVHQQSDQVIGSLFALGSLAMGIGLVLAPPLADKYGKIQLVVFTQALSIPFLAMLGFSPWYSVAAFAYYVRVALMNMSSPVYQTFVMEKVDPSARATIASLVSMASAFGWAFSPTISGWLQVKYGFGPAFAGTIFLYLLSTFLYWWFFWRGRPASGSAPALPEQA